MGAFGMYTPPLGGVVIVWGIRDTPLKILRYVLGTLGKHAVQRFHVAAQFQAGLP